MSYNINVTVKINSLNTETLVLLINLYPNGNGFARNDLFFRIRLSFTIINKKKDILSMMI